MMVSANSNPKETEIKTDIDGLYHVENQDGDVLGLDRKWHSQPGDAEFFASAVSAQRFVKQCGLAVSA